MGFGGLYLTGLGVGQGNIFKPCQGPQIRAIKNLKNWHISAPFARAYWSANSSSTYLHKSFAAHHARNDVELVTAVIADSHRTLISQHIVIKGYPFPPEA